MLRNTVILSFGNCAHQKKYKLSGDGIFVDHPGCSFLGGGGRLTLFNGLSLSFHWHDIAGRDFDWV